MQPFLPFLALHWPQKFATQEGYLMWTVYKLKNEILSKRNIELWTKKWSWESVKCLCF